MPAGPRDGRGLGTSPSYVVVAPPGWPRVMSRAVGRFVGVTAVVPTVENTTSFRARRP